TVTLNGETEDRGNMDNLTAFLTSMVALSIGVERVVEILKGFSKWLREDPDPRLDREGETAGRRRAALQLLAMLFGALIAYVIGPKHFIGSLPDGALVSFTRIASSLLLGFMASGGSALWNHALDIVGAIKTVTERVPDVP